MPEAEPAAAGPAEPEVMAEPAAKPEAGTEAVSAAMPEVSPSRA